MRLRDRDPDEGLISLVTAAACCQHGTADEAVTALLERLEPLATDDDICLLAVLVS
jgi:hypothetical protein